MSKCTILDFTDHASSCAAVEGSSCFYYPTLDLGTLAAHVLNKGELVARAGRIEVSDNTDAKLHKHPGATIAFITSGAGKFLFADGEVRVRAGDTIYIPPYEAHLSVANKGTTMTEWIVYIGEKNDVQTLIEI